MCTKSIVRAGVVVSRPAKHPRQHEEHKPSVNGCGIGKFSSVVVGVGLAGARRLGAMGAAAVDSEVKASDLSAWPVVWVDFGSRTGGKVSRGPAK